MRGCGLLSRVARAFVFTGEGFVVDKWRATEITFNRWYAGCKSLAEVVRVSQRKNYAVAKKMRDWVAFSKAESLEDVVKAVKGNVRY